MSRKRKNPQYLLSKRDLMRLFDIVDRYQSKGFLYWKTKSLRDFLEYEEPFENRLNSGVKQSQVKQ